MGRRRILLTDYEQKKRDERGVEVETPDGQVFVIDPPLFWPDSFAVASEAGDEPAMLAAMLGGADRLAAYEQAGGSHKVMLQLIQEEVLGVGTSLGE